MKKTKINLDNMTLVTDPTDLTKLTRLRSSVYVTSYKRRSPAAFITSMQFNRVIAMIDKKLIYKDNEQI